MWTEGWLGIRELTIVSLQVDGSGVWHQQYNDGDFEYIGNHRLDQGALTIVNLNIDAI
jgi:hypothetical protein